MRELGKEHPFEVVRQRKRTIVDVTAKSGLFVSYRPRRAVVAFYDNKSGWRFSRAFENVFALSVFDLCMRKAI